eukprot:TRINITY_DN5575_c0_g1_i1.p1 TRINITY_DN5575_c0_g1~~TRINITY_DN5575_c0_g1_i1.p1  ORF type:complete len:484 (-),score=114.55 TRINITY_DN5575_c0_g1_i1:538-1920(-)
MNDVMEEDEKKPFIDTELATLKALYFANGGAGVAFLPFLNIWLESQGVSSTQIGIVSSVRQLTNLFGAPFWAGISDKYSIHRKVLFIAIFQCVVARLLLTRLSADYFGVMLALLTFSEFSWSIAGPMIDRICLSMLGESRKHHYGKQRMWGTIGWGGLATPVGKFVEWIGNPNWFFYLHGFGSAFFLVLIAIAPIKEIKQGQVPFWKSLSVIANTKSLVFLSAMVIIGMQNGIIGNYVFLHLKHLGASNTLLGMCLVANTLTEVPAFWFSGEITKAITPEGGILLSAVAAACRLLGYYFLTNPMWVLPLELTHGLTYGLMWASAVQIISGLAPPHLTTTMQGILSATHSGIGSMLGAAIGGILFQRYDATLFLMSIILPIILFFGFGGWVLYEKSEYSKMNEDRSYAMLSLNVMKEKMSPRIGLESDEEEEDEQEKRIENARSSFTLKRSSISREPADHV